MCLAAFDPSTRITTNTRNTLAIQPLMSSGHNRPPKLSSPHFLGAPPRPTSLRITSVSPHRPVPCGAGVSHALAQIVLPQGIKVLSGISVLESEAAGIIYWVAFSRDVLEQFPDRLRPGGRRNCPSAPHPEPSTPERCPAWLLQRYCTITLASAGLVVPRVSRCRSVQWPFASAEALWRRRICSLL